MKKLVHQIDFTTIKGTNWFKGILKKYYVNLSQIFEFIKKYE